MMIKDKEAIEKIKQGGELLGKIVDELINAAKPGVALLELDKIAEKMIAECGGRPAFKGYKPNWSSDGFPGSICTSVNEGVVHGIPTDRVLKDGDLLGIDIGMEWPYKKGEKGYYTDTAVTVGVGEVSEENKKLLVSTQKALFKGISVAKAGNSVADIGRAVEDYIKPQGYGIVTALVGHGVGYKIHEEPNIPNVYRSVNESVKLKEGMVVALEPMIAIGSGDVDTAEDNWTVETLDKSYTAHFEHTIIIQDGEAHIATQRPSEKNI